MHTYIEAVLPIVLYRISCLGHLDTRTPWQTLIAGLWLGMSVWALGALARIWVPIWQVWLLGVAVAALFAILQRRFKRNLQFLTDLAAVAALSLLSVVPINPLRVTAAAILFAAGGFALDSATRRLSVRPQRLLLAWPLLLTLAMALAVTQADDFGTRLLTQDRWFPLRLAAAAPLPGERVPLDSGAVAWLLRRPIRAPRGVAIFLHGNHPGASSQPAAIAMQGALLRAGYDVLAVDHPGYGATPIPRTDDWKAWDPATGPREALALVQAKFPQIAAATIIVGHSMGVDVALQWLREDVTVREIYLFGGAITGAPKSKAEYDSSVKGFHQQRNMACCMPSQTLQAVSDHFYASAELYAAQLPPHHPLIDFVRFGIEYQDVARDREPLYLAISEPKIAIELPRITHYLNTLMLRRLVLLDTQAVVRTAQLFSSATTH